MPDLERTELLKRALDAAIGAMSRNRGLLLTINLIAAVVLVTVYLERESFDEKQRRGHLVAVHGIAKRLTDLRLLQDSSDPDIKEPDNLMTRALKLSGATPAPWTNLYIDGEQVSSRRDWLAKVGEEIYRLNVVRNEMKYARLPQGQMLPIGIAVPQNDFVPVAGLLLLVLYSWLLFSFRQLAAIIERIRKLLTGPSESSAEDPKGIRRVQGMVREIIEFHFLFRTSKRGAASWFVRALYFSPPIVMLIAFSNDLYSITNRSGEWQELLRNFVTFRMLLLVSLTVALTFVAYEVRLADRAVNMASFGREVLGEDDEEPA